MTVCVAEISERATTALQAVNDDEAKRGWQVSTTTALPPRRTFQPVMANSITDDWSMVSHTILGANAFDP